MRKNSPRKWLHAILDLLPVILIPVFMVYSHRHDVTENVQVNYKYQSNEVNSFDDLVPNNIYQLNRLTIETFNDDSFEFRIYSYESVDYSTFEGIDEIIFNSYNSNDNNYLNVYIASVDDAYISFTNFDCYVSLYLDISSQYLAFNNVVFSISEDGFEEGVYYLQEGNGLLPQYTDYNVIESVDTTNTNVMDSFMNKFTTTIDKYFNMGNVFNLNGVYQWFNTNIFNGNAPTIIFSIFQITLYELIMDLLFLLYGLFMWFIDMIEKIMDKPFKSIK